MIKKILLVGMFLQGLSYGFSQQLFNQDFSLHNPAFVGMYDNNNFTFTTSEYYNNDQNYWSKGRASLNFPLKNFFSGVGFHSTYSKAGFASYLDIGAIYSFKYSFSKDLSLSLGSNFSLHRFNLKGDLLMDSYDPWSSLSTYVNIKVFIFNIDFGFWLRYKDLQVGLTNQHLNNPSREYMLGNEKITTQLNSNINAIVNYAFSIGQKHRLKNSLLIDDVKDFSKNKSFILNNLFEINNTYLIGLTTNLFRSDVYKAYLSPNVGYNLANRFRFLLAMDLIRIDGNNSKGKTIEGVLTYNF